MHIKVKSLFLQLSLHTKEGVKLGQVAEMGSWVWCAKVRPDTNGVVSDVPFIRLCKVLLLNTCTRFYLHGDCCIYIDGQSEQLHKVMGNSKTGGGR